MANYKSYDPKKVNVTFVHPVLGPHTVRAFGDGTMVQVSYNADFGTVFVGTQGEGRHVESADRSGQATVSIADNSPSNGFFSNAVKSKTPMALTVTDKSSNADLFYAGSVMIGTLPDMTKANENTVNEWVWNFTKGEMNRSGAEI